jgi:phosphoglycerate-specific signal transduction histidine kinase
VTTITKDQAAALVKAATKAELLINADVSDVTFTDEAESISAELRTTLVPFQKGETEMFLVDEKTYLQLEKAAAAARVLLIDTEVALSPTEWVYKCAAASRQLREAFAELDKLGYKPGEHV